MVYFVCLVGIQGERQHFNVPEVKVLCVKIQDEQ